MHKHTTLPDDPATGYGLSPTETNYGPWSTDGLTKREHFAALALQGLLANPDTPVIPVDVANNAIRYADALIAALNSFDTTPQ